MEQNKQWENWLKCSYRDAPTEGPETKSTLFSDIHQGLVQQFPSDKISVQSCSQTVFPETKRIHLGKRLTVELEQLTSTSDTVKAEITQVKDRVRQLQERIRELEAESAPSTSVQCTCTPILMQQMDSLLRHGDQIVVCMYVTDEHVMCVVLCVISFAAFLYKSVS